MKMTPIKKLVICIAAVSIAMTVITTNILSSVFTLKAAQNNMAREKALMQQIDEHNNNSNNGGYVNNGSSNGGYVSTTPGSNSGSNGGSSNSGSNGGSNGGSSADSNTPAGDNGGSQDAGASQQDGLKMYVDALNKAKSSATKVTRVRTNASNYKDHVKAGMLSSIAKSLMGTFMKEDTTPVDIDKNDLPPKGLNCTLDASAVDKVDVQKDGDNTIVTIVTKAESNPKAGSGIGSAVSIIEEKTITDAVEGVIEISNIKLDYDPCTLKATIDASGNLVALYVQAPCILSLSAMGIDAEVGIDCEDEFVIAY